MLPHWIEGDYEYETRQLMGPGGLISVKVKHLPTGRLGQGAGHLDLAEALRLAHSDLELHHQQVAAVAAALEEHLAANPDFRFTGQWERTTILKHALAFHRDAGHEPAEALERGISQTRHPAGSIATEGLIPLPPKF